MGAEGSDEHSQSTDDHESGGTDLTHDGTLDMLGHPASKKTSGGWNAAIFILALQTLMSTAYYGIANNLVIYLTTVMHESSSSAVKSVSNWVGTAYVTPLIGAFVADAFLGRYRTALSCCCIYIFGLVLLTVSAGLPSLRPPQCPSEDVKCESSSAGQASFLFLGLYVMNLGAGGVYGTITALGGDQFEEGDAEEQKQKNSFFNWFYQSMFTGSLIACTFSVYLEDNVSWGLGWGLSTGAVILSTCLLLMGSPRYRYHRPNGHMSRVLTRALGKGKRAQIQEGAAHKITQSTGRSSVMEEGEQEGDVVGQHDCNWISKRGEGVQFVIRVLPTWLTSILYSTVYSQISTLFVMQGSTMDRYVTSKFQIPPATLTVFESSSVIVWVVIYDRLLVPFLRTRTGNPRGISELVRIGIGLVLSILAMVIAAIVEAHRLNLVRKYNLLEDTEATVPMTVFLEVPQYLVMGASEVFIYIGLLEFFYNQAPYSIRSLGNALSMMGVALGYFLSSCLVSIVNSISKQYGENGWIADNLNKGRIDLFYSLLAVLSSINLVIFVICAKKFKKVLRNTSQQNQVNTSPLTGRGGNHNTYPLKIGKDLEYDMDKIVLPTSDILS